jgi:hypothetical protein
VQPANAVFEAHFKFHSEEAGLVMHIGASYVLHWTSSFDGHYLHVLSALSNFWYKLFNIGVSRLFVHAWRFSLEDGSTFTITELTEYGSAGQLYIAFILFS